MIPQRSYLIPALTRSMWIVWLVIIRVTDHDALDGPPKPKAGQWVRPPEARIAHWQGAPRDPALMDTCFACHSLRTPLTDGFHPEAAFLDQFRPESVIPPFYQADGQIEEEVYVYGSFLQSKMYQAGVQCQDCHDPHTAEVKVQGNGLCLTCHQPKAYETPQHHGHALGSQAAQCVTCHMPGKTYMGVDFRRDHRFGVPNAPISHALDTRDVCQSCHEDRWAAFLGVTENLARTRCTICVSDAPRPFDDSGGRRGPQ